MLVMITNTSKCMRSDQLFMRNEYAGRGKWNIPLVRKQELNVDNLSLIACSDTKANDFSANTQNGVHFFTLNGTTSLTCQIKETKKLTFIRCIIPTAKSQPLLVIAVSITGRFIAYFKRLRDAFGIIQLQLMD